jgi:NAD+ synthase
MKNKLDAKREVEKCIYFIQNIFKYKNFKHAVVGVSGGLDSAVIVALCSRALGNRNVTGLLLPYGEQKDIHHSRSVIDKFNIHAAFFNIKPIVDAFHTDDKRRLGNIMARVRMMILYNSSAINNALVVGTSNKTELDLGYFTLHGDGACALEPIGHLYKTEVREIAKELKVPKEVIKKHPSAGLWENQTDEQEIGCSYEIMDKILKIYNPMMKDPNNFRDHSRQEIVNTIVYNHKNIPVSVIDKIITRVEQNKFKLEAPSMLGC